MLARVSCITSCSLPACKSGCTASPAIHELVAGTTRWVCQALCRTGTRCHQPTQIEQCPPAQGNGGASGPSPPRRSPAELVPLIMLPVLIWLGLDILHITLRAAQPSISAKPGVTFGHTGSAQAPAPPPPPQEWQYWQKVGHIILL